MSRDRSFVMVGFGAGILPGLNAVLPPGSLTIVEEPDMVKVRDVRKRMTAFGCVAGLVEAPVQDEDCVPSLVSEWPLPDGVTAVMPGLEYGVVGAAALAEHLRLPGAGVGAARTLRDKVALRTAADAAGIAQPRWREVWSAADVRAFGSGPRVLKPANRQASVGVQLLDGDDDLDAAWQHTVDADEPLMRARSGPKSRFLAEERLSGPEISVEALVSDGQIVFGNTTAKTVRPGRYPVELGHLVPGPAEPRIGAAMRALVAATGFRAGTLHAEWILVEDEPHLVECAGRLPGDEIVPLIDLAYGGSLVADLVAILSGRPVARPAVPARAAAVRFLTAEPGLVTRVRGESAARSIPGVTDVKVTAHPGDRVADLTSSWDRVGRVIAVGVAPGDAAGAAASAAAAIGVSTYPGEISVVTDPRTAGDWWPARPGDPRDALDWAAGVSDPVRFLGLAGGPGLWLRGQAASTGRMDPVNVLSGAVAEQQADLAAVRAALAAHPRFLVSAATGYGSPLSRATEASPGELQAIVAALVSEAHAEDSTPVVLHCPAGNPLLSALSDAGFAVGVTDLYPTMELPGASMDDYLAGLSRGRRSAVRQELRAAATGTAEIHVGEAARPHLAAASRLSASAYRQRRQPADDDRALPIYSRLIDECGDDFALTLVSDDGGPVASACLIAGKTDLLLYSAGHELPRARRVAGYFNAAYYLPIELAYRRGLRRILLGPTGWHTKSLRGARFTPLCSAVPAAAAELAALLTVTDQRLRAALGQLNGS